jgi:hypothetical protein
VLLCRAKVDESGEEPSLILEEAFPIQEALSQFTGGLQLSVSREDEGVLERLRTVLAGHRGKSPLYLQVRGTDGSLRRVRAGKEWRVALSEDLARELVGTLGEGRVGLVRV